MAKGIRAQRIAVPAQKRRSGSRLKGIGVKMPCSRVGNL